MSLPQKLKIFQDHGVSLSDESGNQLIGYCPFTGREGKFYINRDTLLWDSKTGGQSGNVHDFLRLIASHYAQSISDEQVAALARDRGLPRSAFYGLELGYREDKQCYTLPIRDTRSRVVDIRMYRLGNRVISTEGVQVGLFRAEDLAAHLDWDVYLCEGEWDTVALRWLLNKLKQPGVVVGVPGAGVLKPDWMLWLSGRTVHTLYDNDGPGEHAEHQALKKLKGRAQRLTFTHWPAGLPTGFDVRDWIIAGALEQKKPRTCLKSLKKLFREIPRQTTVEGPESSPSTESSLPETMEPARESKWKKPPRLRHVYDEFKRWLYLDSTDAIDIMLATAISQQIDGEPIWMFLVGPPGSAKTETLSSLSWVSNTYMTSSVTPHSLISGASWNKGEDPSLIPRLNGKVMVIKDFTSILAMRDTEKDEIFGILRDAYDGKCGKEFGNGIIRNYESRFTVLAAVTPSIYALSSSHTALGERFLKFGVGDNLVHRSEEQIIERAINNINQETTMRNDLADVVDSFLSRRIRLDTIDPKALPDLNGFQPRVVALARFGARMRGTVTRDTYRNDIITSRPSAEVGSRLGKQLAKLCQSLAVIRQRTNVTHDDYRLAKKVMLDTIPQRTEDILRSVLRACPTPEDTLNAQEIAQKTRYPITTVTRILQDLNVLDIMTRIPVSKGRSEWTVSPYIRSAIEKAELYQSDDELNRPTRMVIRIVRRKKKTT